MADSYTFGHHRRRVNPTEQSHGFADQGLEVRESDSAEGEGVLNSGTSLQGDGITSGSAGVHS